MNINKLIKKHLLTELDYNDFMNRGDLESLRDALKKNKTVSVVFVKKDGTVRPMAVRRTLSSYVASDREKSERQTNVEVNNNLKKVIDINSYIKGKKAGLTPEESSKRSWRSINLENVLGFMVSGQFIDLREENQIMDRFGEEVYNSLTRTMKKVMERELEDANVDLGGDEVGEINEVLDHKPTHLKDPWDRDDQIIAMYNSLYGLEKLGFTEKNVANNAIGTTAGSLKMQTSNFDYLDGRDGLDRPNKTQTEVYNTYKNYDPSRFSKLCNAIIKFKLDHPSKDVEKFNEIENEIKKGKERSGVTYLNDLEDEKYEKERKKHDWRDLTFDGIRDKEELKSRGDDFDLRVKKEKEDIIIFLRDVFKKVHEITPLNFKMVSRGLIEEIDFALSYLNISNSSQTTLIKLIGFIKTLLKNMTQDSVEKLKSKILKQTRYIAYDKIPSLEINENKIKTMKKKIRITESQLNTLIKKTIKEQMDDDTDIESIKNSPIRLGSCFAYTSRFTLDFNHTIGETEFDSISVHVTKSYEPGKDSTFEYELDVTDEDGFTQEQQQQSLEMAKEYVKKHRGLPLGFAFNPHDWNDVDMFD